MIPERSPSGFNEMPWCELRAPMRRQRPAGGIRRVACRVRAPAGTPRAGHLGRYRTPGGVGRSASPISSRRRSGAPGSATRISRRTASGTRPRRHSRCRRGHPRGAGADAARVARDDADLHGDQREAKARRHPRLLGSVHGRSARRRPGWGMGDAASVNRPRLRSRLDPSRH